MTDQVAVILQARVGSSRLPEKVLADLAGRPMLAFLVERLKRCTAVDQIILATTDLVEDQVLVELGHSLGLIVVRGSKNDVLSRFVLAANNTNASTLVRITGDCPLIDPDLLGEMLQEFQSLDVDYYSNCTPPSYPDGLDIEVFTRHALLLAQKNVLTFASRTCNTLDSRECQFCIAQKQHHTDLSSMRWTVDEPEDLQVIRAVVAHFDGHWISPGSRSLN